MEEARTGLKRTGRHTPSSSFTTNKRIKQDPMQTALNDAMNQLSADLMWPTILNHDQSERGRSRENALLQHVLMALTLQLEKNESDRLHPP
jgi:hypothetical protein